MPKNVGNFFQFNTELCMILKKTSYDSILSDIRNDYTRLNGTIKGKIQTEFSRHTDLIYKNKEDRLIDLSCFKYDDSTLPEYLQFTIDKIQIVVEPSFRVVYKTKDTTQNIDSFIYDRKLFDDATTVSSKLYFEKWSKFAPSAMLRVCQKTDQAQFYYNLFGYTSTNTKVNSQ